jgi:hypothetical protein
MAAKNVGTSGRRDAHASRSRWTDRGKSGTPVVVRLAAVEDASGESGARVNVARGRFLYRFLRWFLDWG